VRATVAPLIILQGRAHSVAPSAKSLSWQRFRAVVRTPSELLRKALREAC